MSYTIEDLEKDYYLGNYQSCINKSNLMPTTRESTFYMCLSYFHLKKYDVLELELRKSDELCVQLIGQLLEIAIDQQSADRVIVFLDRLLEEKKVDPKDDLSRLVIASIFLNHRNYSSAITTLHSLDSLPSHLAKIGVYIQMQRLDLAEKQLKLMQSKDDFSTLTMLAIAQIRLATGNPREAYDIAVELADKFRATPLLKNMQTVAAISMNNFTLGKKHAEESLDLDSDNIEALINMVYIYSVSRTSEEAKKKHLDRIRTLDKHHEFIKMLDQIDVQ